MRSIVVVCFIATDSSGIPALPPPTVFFVAATTSASPEEHATWLPVYTATRQYATNLTGWQFPFYIDTLPTCEGRPQVTGTVSESL